jgi:predicted dithiol-disulfide oxidoreductase (DUF899 family)
METTRTRFLYIMVGCAFGYLLVSAKPMAAQGDCKLLMDAGMKVFDTSNHAYTTMNLAGTPQTAESIYAGGKVYVKYNGKWSTGSTTQEIKELAEKNRRINKTTCQYLRDESVNGEMATVYSMHDVSPKGTTDSNCWISKAKGLPLRTDVDLGGKSHMSTRYEYGDVRPPM